MNVRCVRQRSHDSKQTPLDQTGLWSETLTAFTEPDSMCALLIRPQWQSSFKWFEDWLRSFTEVLHVRKQDTPFCPDKSCSLETLHLVQSVVCIRALGSNNSEVTQPCLYMIDTVTWSTFNCTALVALQPGKADVKSSFLRLVEKWVLDFYIYSESQTCTSSEDDLIWTSLWWLWSQSWTWNQKPKALN